MTPHHILIFKCDDGKRFLSVSVDKFGERWGTFGESFQSLRHFDGWIRFLKEQGHIIYGKSLDEMVANGMPLLAVKPGGDKTEAMDAAQWFMMELHKEDT